MSRRQKHVTWPPTCLPLIEMRRLLLPLPLLLTVHVANAHGDIVHADNPWIDWNADPWLLALLAAVSAWYWIGWRRLRVRSRQSRGLRRRALLFSVGMLCLAFALLSPLDTLAAALVSIHMVQHMLLIIVAAPLLVLAAPLPMFAWGLPAGSRLTLSRGTRLPVVESAWDLLTLPLVAWLLHGAFLWLWHAPVLYQAALEHRVVHDLEHASFLANALLFWWVVLRALARSAASNATALLLLFTTFLHGGLLAALMTFSSSPWYPVYVDAAARWNISALEDQQLAGLIMWLPAGITYMVAGLALLAMWMRRLDQHESVAVRAWSGRA